MAPKNDPKLGDFELLLVLAMAHLGEGAYGAALAREIEERTGRHVSLGAVYKTLERLLAKGYATSRVGEPRAERGGRRRKHYRLSAVGRGVLDRTLADLDAMRQGLDPQVGSALV